MTWEDTLAEYKIHLSEAEEKLTMATIRGEFEHGQLAVNHVFDRQKRKIRLDGLIDKDGAIIVIVKSGYCSSCYEETLGFWNDVKVDAADLLMHLLADQQAVVAVMGFAMVGKTLWTLRGVKCAGNDGGLPEGRGDLPIPLAFVGLVWYLVPEFPWWISAFFGFVWTPIYSYIGAHMIGLTGSPRASLWSKSSYARRGNGPD